MTADLMLLCHGPTRATRLAAFPADEDLDPAAPGAQRRPGISPGPATQVWVSPARRAQQTAEWLELAGIRPEPALRDCDYGRWAGRTLADVSEDDPEAFSRWLADPDAAPHGGEALSDVVQRVGSWLDDRASASGRLLAVTHASVIRAAVTCVLAAPLTAFWRIDVEPLSLVRLRSDGRRWALRLGA